MNASEHGQQMWAQLEVDFRWSTSFFVVYGFAATPGQARALGQRLREYADPATLHAHEARSAEDLRRLAADLPQWLEDASRPTDFFHRPILWVDGSLEFEHDQAGPWRRAWSDLIARLNERRELVRANLRAVIVIAPVQAKPFLRAIGPDLWSIRSQTLEFPRPELRVPGPASPRPRRLDPEAAQRARALPPTSARDESPLELLRQQSAALRGATRLARAEASSDAFEATQAIRSSILSVLASLDPEAYMTAQARAEVFAGWIEQVEVACELDHHSESRGREFELATEWLARLDAAFEQPFAHPSPRELLLRAQAKVIAGELALRGADPARATRAFAEANEQLGQPSPLAARIELGLARAARSLGDYEAAERAYLRGLAIERQTIALRELGTLVLERDEPERALLLLREALELADPREVHEQVALHRELAAAAMFGGHWPAASALLEQARARADEGSALEADVLVDLAQWQRAMDEESLARGLRVRALAIRRATLGDEHPLTRALESANEAIMKSTIVLLHVSDLHFGPHSRFESETPESAGKRLAQAIAQLRASQGIPEVDVVVASGDLTAAAKPAEFVQARKFFEALVGEFGLTRDRFAFVPGNHDFSWAKIKLARAQQEDEEFDDDELARRIHETKFVHYREFLDAFYGDFAKALDRRPLSPSGWVHELPELRLSLGLLNSSECETERERGGAVSTRQAQALLDHWRGPDEARLRVVVVHHNPKSNTPGNVEYAKAELAKRVDAGTLDRAFVDHFVGDIYGFSGTPEFESLVEQAKVPLVLHGHIHAPKVESVTWQRDGETKILGAGSAGAGAGHLPADQPNTIQLLVLRLDEGRADVHRLIHDARAKVEGSVVNGNFVPEVEQTGGIASIVLSLPPSFAASAPAPVVRAEPAAIDRGFAREYRTRLGHQHEVWEFGAMQRGVREASVVTLDGMYVPLRFHAELDVDTPEQGTCIEPEQVLARTQHLVIRGGPGSGKTTWLRWTFRRLLEREDALPIFIELRALAKGWDTAPAKFEDYLAAWVDRRVGAGWRDAFMQALNQAHPRPVVLIDGWDELGELGVRFAEQLASFADAYPQVRLVATSRPYGEGVPQRGDRFEHVQVQPMSDDEVATFIRNFYEQVHRSEAHEVRENVDRFLATLAVNPRARALGRTPLLLVLLLIVGRDQPLPDQRHDLYRVCLENLLDFRPKKRQQGGVLMGSSEWAPERYAEREQATAKLAFAMQSARAKKRGGREALAKRAELVRALPQNWDPHQREGFVSWLASGAGVLIERDDATFQFAHLGFQEYLAAWHLDATHEGKEARLALCRDHARNLGWWETLRLWAAILHSRSPEWANEVLLGLVDEGEPALFWLAGSMLADGVGSEAFAAWLDGMPGHFGPGQFQQADACAEAWEPCQQHLRRSQVVGRLASAVPTWSWIGWWRANEWWRAGGFEGELPKPCGSGAAAILEAFDRGPATNEAAIAWGRIWLSSSPRWGEPSIELLALRSWPNRRMWMGTFVQTAVGFGANPTLVGRTRWDRMLWTKSDGPSATSLARFLARDITRDITRDIARDIAGNHAWNLAWNLAKFPARNLAMFHARNLAWNLTRNHARSVARDIARNHTRDIARDIAWDIAWDASLPLSQELATHHLFSAGFAGTRAILAHSEDPSPLARLFATATRCSLDPTLDPSALTLPFDGHELWPALARHVARISTPADRALLEHYAANPEDADTDLLRWALRYWVRGDIMFEDGSVMTLDDLWAKLRVNFPEDDIPDLPLLEDMQPELEIDWDAEEPETAPTNS